MPKQQPVISVENVSFAYDDTPTLQDVTFSVAAGELVGIIGPNGGGKTTLFRLLLGFLKPDKGRIRVLGATPKKARGRLAYVPQTLRFLPKPGNWMIAFKQFMGFLMLATVLWLLWVFTAQTSSQALFVLLGALLTLSIGCWVYGSWGTPAHSRIIRSFATVSSVALIALGVLTAMTAVEPEEKIAPSILALRVSKSSSEGDWEPFSARRLQELRSKGTPVFIDFTAKWCLICQANKIALSADAVQQAFKDLGIVKMRADWTKRDDQITEALTRFGRNSVPLYIFYGPDSQKAPIILPQNLSESNILESIQKLYQSDPE